MKKLFAIIQTVILSSVFAFGVEFTPQLHSAPSVRQQGFGGLFTTDADNYWGFYANPAMLGRHKKHSLFPGIEARVAGPLEDYGTIISSLSGGDLNALKDVINKNKGLKLSCDVQPLLSFGHISEWGFGWGFKTQVFANASIPSATISDIEVGIENVLTLGFGLRVINTANNQLYVGATAKGFAQTAFSYTGNPLQLVNKITTDFSQIPLNFSAGYGFDVGLMYTLCHFMDVSVVCYDVFTQAFISPINIKAFKFDFSRNTIIQPRLAAGVAFNFPVEWTRGVISSAKVMVDYRDFFVFFKPLSRNPLLELSAGLELTLANIFSVRFGMQELYPAVGVGFNFGNFKIDASLYGRELGVEPGNAPCLNASVFIGVAY